nr:MAG TPA: hypothetical protein [Caudoviricetes sp.]
MPINNTPFLKKKSYFSIRQVRLCELPSKLLTFTCCNNTLFQ